MFGKKCHDTIWVCVGLKDRSENLKRLVNSLKNLYNNHNFALSVHDQGSVDSADLQLWLKQNWSGKLIWSSSETDFSRSLAFNYAVKQAEGNLVFICDADMVLPPNLEQQIRLYTRPHMAWFPVCQWQIQENKTEWMWFTRGTGLFSAHREWHKRALGYDETIKSWGGEDWGQFFRFYKNGFMPLRTRCKGLYHCWHSPSEPEGWVKLF